MITVKQKRQNKDPLYRQIVQHKTEIVKGIYSMGSSLKGA